MAKREIARYDQSLLLLQCFQNLSAAEASENIYMWEMVNPLSDMLFKSLSLEMFLRKNISHIQMK